MINVSTNREARLRRKATNRMRPVAVGRARGKNVFKLKNMGSGLEREEENVKVFTKNINMYNTVFPKRGKVVYL